MLYIIYQISSIAVVEVTSALTITIPFRSCNVKLYDQVELVIDMNGLHLVVVCCSEE